MSFDRIILVSIDNLRADCLSANSDKAKLAPYNLSSYGSTPTLDALASQGAFFTHCFSAASYTTASHASMLTGLYPAQHGVREYYRNGIRKNVRTLFQILKDAGYDLDAGHAYAVAAVAGVVAQVTSDTGPKTSFARQMAEPAPGSRKARVSGLRLDRLVGQQQREIACLLLIPVMELLSRTVNLTDMAHGLYKWDTAARKRWADDYYGVASTRRK